MDSRRPQGVKVRCWGLLLLKGFKMSRKGKRKSTGLISKEILREEKKRRLDMDLEPITYGYEGYNCHYFGEEEQYLGQKGKILRIWKAPNGIMHITVDVDADGRMLKSITTECSDWYREKAPPDNVSLFNDSCGMYDIDAINQREPTLFEDVQHETINSVARGANATVLARMPKTKALQLFDVMYHKFRN